jgi:hypothetical protein
VSFLDNWVLVILGVVMIVIVLDAAIRTFVVPRGSVVLFTAIVFVALRYFLGVFARPSHGYERRDRVMALYAPFALLLLPVMSLIMVWIAYAFIYAGLEAHGWRDAFVTSGSCLLTLGFERPPDLPSTLVGFTEAGVGLGLLAIVIAYLPTIYNAFSRREIAVTDLAIRGGTPPTAVELLTRAHITGFLEEMDGFWDSWFAWFTELGETHTTYGALAFFRSPNPHRSWVTSAGAVLDIAAFRISVLDIPWTPNAPLCIRAGFLALREVAGFFGFDYENDPDPGDPISVTRDEFDGVYDTLQQRGVPVKADREQAWRDFSGWRVNYDSVLLSLAGLVMAPYAPWISDRSPRTPLARHMWGKRRREISRRAGTS